MKKIRYDSLIPISWSIGYGGKASQVEIFNQEEGSIGEKVCVKISFKEDEEFRKLKREQTGKTRSGLTDYFSREIISDRDFIVLLIDTLERIEVQKPGDEASVKFSQIVIQYDECKKICAILIDTQGRRYKISVSLALFIQLRKPEIGLFAHKSIFADSVLEN